LWYGRPKVRDKKGRKKPRIKLGKYEEPLKINGSFEDVIKVALIPKPNR
jgi:hypothetical protein